MAKNHWLRIGIVLSVIWFIAFGGYQWTFSTQHNGDVYRSRLGKCEEILGTDNQFNRAKYEKCLADAKEGFLDNSDRLYKGIPILLFLDLLTIAIGWALVWNVTLVVRWAGRDYGFSG